MIKALFNFVDIGAWNIQGLFESINGTKYCKLDDDLAASTINKLDIICLQETHCGPDDLKQLSLPGFIWKHFNGQKVVMVVSLVVCC